MVFFPNCKINIGLDILRRRSDGYHDIETVMVPVVGLCDILEVVPADKPGVEFSSGGLAVDCREGENLCIKAYNALAARYEIGGAKIHLHKIIPFGAGLGGGSSDAVFTLQALCKMFSLDPGVRILKDVAAELGSDTAFFVDNAVALSSGRGEVLEPVSVPQLAGKTLLIVKPPLGVSTAMAYGAVSPCIPPVPLAERLELPLENWKGAIENCFEKPVFARYPRLAAIKASLYEAGAVYASMSGSGSALYGIFDDQSRIDPVKELFPDCFLYSDTLAL